jgi:hypothetical protein
VEDSTIETTLDDALTAFYGSGSDPETGLDVDQADLLQLRKACRLLRAIDALRDDNGYYTVIIEASFAAIERTLQYYLYSTGLIDEEDYVDHHRVYELGEAAGLYSEDFKDKLVELWEKNRSRTYYREGVGTAESAALMADLAHQIHSHVLHLSQETHECICRD